MNNSLAQEMVLLNLKENSGNSIEEERTHNQMLQKNGKEKT